MISKIYAIDFDGTLCRSMYPEIGDPITANIEYIKGLKEEGHQLILWTCRCGDLLDDAIEWCKEQGLEFDGINENLKDIIEQFDSDSRKIFAHHYIDDRNFYIEQYREKEGEGMAREGYFKTEFQVRSSEEGEDRFLEGYFIRFNEETELWGGVYEEVSPDSITDSLKTNDIRCLFNHDTGIVLGRTGNNTLELKKDDVGLFGRVKINPNDKQAMDILARVERNDINACSFGFNILNEEMQNREDGTVKFILKEIDLHEVSPVTFPAYPTTSIQAREKDIEKHEQRKVEVLKNKLKERLNKIC